MLMQVSCAWMGDEDSTLRMGSEGAFDSTIVAEVWQVCVPAPFP